MDAGKLYRTQLFFTTLFGFPLDYQEGWRGNLMKFYTCCVILSNIVTDTFTLHFIFLGNYKIEEFSEVCASLIAALETAMKMILLYYWGYKLKKLFHSMGTILNSGSSLKSDRFDKITGIGKKIGLDVHDLCHLGDLFSYFWRSVQNVHEFPKMFALQNQVNFKKLVSSSKILQNIFLVSSLTCTKRQFPNFCSLN